MTSPLRRAAAVVGRPRLFVELCCGSAAVTLRLLGGPLVKPPIAYMGSKRGFAGPILHAMGLRAGQGADAVLLVDAGPWGDVWAALADPETGVAVAEKIRSWKDEDPRALWDRLRAEGAADPASWLYLGNCSYAAGTGHGGFVHPELGGRYGASRDHLARATATATLVLAGDRHKAESVAAFLAASGGTWPDDPPDISATATATASPTLHARSVTAIRGDARDVAPPDDCDGVWCYIDPPYRGTAGYTADLPRADVLAVARRWSDAGAVVAVSETEPPDLPGWHSIQIDHARTGQKRTFSRQQEEWLTLNREPMHIHPRQMGMFRSAGSASHPGT